MACGHQEISKIALYCHIEAIFAPVYSHFGQLGVDETLICNNNCLPAEESGPQETEVRSGEICGPCQVAVGEILDGLVRDVDGAEANHDQHWMMSGGLDADTIDVYPENALDDFEDGAGG
jgi:hypothetical protein